VTGSSNLLRKWAGAEALDEHEQNLNLQNKYYQLLHEASLGLLNRMDRHDLMQSILRLLAESSGIHHSFLFLYDPGTDRMLRRFGAGIHESLPVDVQSFGRGEAVVGTVWETGKTLLVEDYRVWEKKDADAMFSRFTTIFAVPVRRGNDEVVGVIGLTFLDEIGRFEPELMKYLERVSQVVAVALDNLRLFETLQESEANARALFEQSADALALMDIQTKQFVRVNDRFLEMSGYTRAELMKMNAYDITADSREGVDRRFDPEYLSGENGPVSETRRLRCREGRIIDVERTLVRIVMDDRILILGTFHDITAEKWLREQMKVELRGAGTLQRSLLPQDSIHGNVEIRTLYEPHHEVSGDFYWYRWNKTGTVLQGFLLDVMGHGIGTALQTAALNVLFHQAVGTKTCPPRKPCCGSIGRHRLILATVPSQRLFVLNSICRR
jgi:PAS domain S-box-containing protein